MLSARTQRSLSGFGYMDVGLPPASPSDNEWLEDVSCLSSPKLSQSTFAPRPQFLFHSGFFFFFFLFLS